MIFNVVILSPHGYFGQSNVLGLPDTGGQVVYILDQVRALEKEMRQRTYDMGLDIEPKIIVVTRLIPDAQGTTCNIPREDITGTTNARIRRIPFRTPAGDIVPKWISRFKIWPYLEQFTLDAEKEILNAAVEDGILDFAQENAETYVTRLILSLGFEKVEFTEVSPADPTSTP